MGIHFMDIAVLPEALFHHQEFKNRVSGPKNSRHGPAAFILPTTPETVSFVGRNPAIGCPSIVGALKLPESGITAGELLSFLPHSNCPNVLIFSDQLVNPVDATVMLRTHSGNFFVSPIELILNQRHGYRIVSWHASAFMEIEPACSDSSRIYRNVIEHLKSCDALGDQWLARTHQFIRTPAARVHNAKRKLRLFHSAVLDAYLEDLDDEALKKAVERIEVLRRQVGKWSLHTC